MQTRKTAIGTSTNLPTSMADLRGIVRLDPNNFNTSLNSFILDKALQLIETPVTNPIVHNSPSSLFPYSFEVFHNNLVSVEVGNNIFTYTMVYMLHPTSFSSREFSKQSLTGTSAFRLKFGTQILEFPFDLFDFSRIIKPAVRSDSKVVYSEVNAKNSSLRATVRLRDSNLSRECEDKETSAFFIHPKQALTNFPTEILSVTCRDVKVELLPTFKQPNNQSISFDISTSWEVVSNRSFFDDWLTFSLLNHTTSLPHASDSYLGRQFESFPNCLIDGIMQFEVLSYFMFPSIINTELNGFSVSLDSINYFFSWIDSDFSTNSCSHNSIEEEQVYKCLVFYTETVSTRKPLNLNYLALPKSLMWGSLNVQPIEKATTSNSGGGHHDYKRISALQSSKIQSGCEDSNSEDRFSLQVQYKLPHYLDSEVSEESACGEGS